MLDRLTWLTPKSFWHFEIWRPAANLKNQQQGRIPEVVYSLFSIVVFAIQIKLEIGAGGSLVRADRRIRKDFDVPSRCFRL